MKKFDGEFKYLLTTEDCYQQARKDFLESGFIRELTRKVRKQVEAEHVGNIKPFLGVVNVDDPSEPPIELPAVAHFAATTTDNAVVIDAGYTYQKDFKA